MDNDRAHSPVILQRHSPHEEHGHVSSLTAQGCKIVSPFIKRVMISQVGPITNSRLCAFISNAVTLNAVTSSLIWEGRMIDQSVVQWSIPGPGLALNRSSRRPCGDFTRVRGRKYALGAVTFVLPLLIMAPF